MTELLARAERFRQLHRDLLILPNAWDAASARMIEQAGAAAIATTSAGVAWSRGVRDAGGLTGPVALEVVASVVASVRVPVTADIEWGYADDPDGVATTVTAALDTGAVGVNLEDSRNGVLMPADTHAELVAAAADAAHTGPVAGFLNARVDTYLFADPAAGDLLEDAVHRATTYAEHGADGVFVPGLHDPAAIAAVVAAVDVPVNVMVGPGAPSLAELRACGVRRISLGAQLAQTAYGAVRTWAHDVLTDGAWGSLPAGATAADLE